MSSCTYSPTRSCGSTHFCRMSGTTAPDHPEASEYRSLDDRHTQHVDACNDGQRGHHVEHRGGHRAEVVGEEDTSDAGQCGRDGESGTP